MKPPKHSWPCAIFGKIEDWVQFPVEALLVSNKHNVFKLSQEVRGSGLLPVQCLWLSFE